MPDTHKDISEHEAELRSKSAGVAQVLRPPPSGATVVYDEAVKSASSPIVVERLRDHFGPVLRLLSVFREIGEGSWSSFLEQYAAARRTDQRHMLATLTEHFIALGLAAETGAREVEVLKSLGQAFPILVLEGTAEQRLCCNLAIALARARFLPAVLIDMVVRPLIHALITVLRISAPRTAMLAVEATGALLKLVQDPVSEFSPYALPVAKWDRDSPESASYLRHAERDRLMALAIAGVQDARAQYFQALERPLDEALAGRSEEVIEAQILQRVELLRVLPALIRQSNKASE